MGVRFGFERKKIAWFRKQRLGLTRKLFAIRGWNAGVSFSGCCGWLAPSRIVRMRRILVVAMVTNIMLRKRRELEVMPAGSHARIDKNVVLVVVGIAIVIVLKRRPPCKRQERSYNLEQR